MVTDQEMKALWAEARTRTGETLKAGDKETWTHYESLKTYEQRLAWRLEIGLEEFFRLQRLSFHGFI